MGGIGAPVAPYRSECKEDEVMTEATSDTNDDIVREAFEHLNAQEQDEEDEDEEMVLYPRCFYSPFCVPLSNRFTGQHHQLYLRSRVLLPSHLSSH